MSANDFIFKNLGTGSVSSYRVSFGDTLVEVFESGAPYETTGWAFPGGWFVGVWDGLLQVTLAPIANAVPSPFDATVLAIDGGLLVYYGFKNPVILASTPDSVIGIRAKASKQAQNVVRTPSTRKTVAIDFDGVLAQYAGNGSHDAGSPIPGAKAFVFGLLDAGLDVAIFSVRPSGQIHDWLKANGFDTGKSEGKRGELYVSTTKPKALVYIDDRGARFEGNFEAMLPLIFKEPWWKPRKSEPQPRIYQENGQWFER